MHTIYYTKLFASGNLKGLSVNCEFTASLPTCKRIRLHSTGKDIITGARYEITDVSFQKYAR